MQGKQNKLSPKSCAVWCVNGMLTTVNFCLFINHLVFALFFALFVCVIDVHKWMFSHVCLFLLQYRETCIAYYIPTSFIALLCVFSVVFEIIDKQWYNFFLVSKRSTCIEKIDLIKRAQSQTPNQLSRVQTHVSFTLASVFNPSDSHPESQHFASRLEPSSSLREALFPPVPERFWTPEHLSLQAFFTHMKTLFQLWSYSLPLKCIKCTSKYKL